MSGELPQSTDRAMRADAHTLDLFPSAVVAFDDHWRIVGWNLGAERLYGLPRDAAIGLSALDLLVMGNDIETAAQILDGLRAGMRWEGRLEARSPEGAPLGARVVLNPVLDDDGAFVGALAVAGPGDGGPDMAGSSRSAVDRLQDIRTIADSALSHLDLESLLHELLSRVRDRLRADTATILLLGEDGQLRVRASLGREGRVVEHLAIPVGSGVAGRIAAARRPLLLDDLSGQEVLAADLRERAASILGAPIMVGDSPIGVIHVGSALRGHFTPDDIPLLELAAERAAVGLENWRLYQAEQQARRRWEAAARRLGRLGVLIARLATRVTEADIVDALVSEAMPFLGASGLWIYRLDDDAGALRAIATRGYPRDVEEALRVVPLTADRPSVRSVRTGSPVFVRSAEELLATYPDFVAHAGKIRGGASAALPLAVGARPFGAIVLQWDAPRGFDDEERSYLSALTDQIAQTFERASLYEAERAARAAAEAAVFRTTVLQDLTSDLSAAITTDDVAATIIERGLRMVGAVAGALFVPSADGRALEVFADFGYPPDVVEPFRRMPLDAETPAVVAFRSRAPVLLPDVARRNSRFPDVAGHMPDDHASVALPLVAGDAVGAIGLTFGEPRTFGAEEVAFMSALADQCALALERARLHDAERRERKRSAFLAVLSGALAQSLNFERTLAKVVRLVVNGVEADGEAIAGLADRCEIDLLAQDGTIEVAAVDHRDHDVARLAREHREHHPIRCDDDGLVATVLRSGRSELIAGPMEDPTGGARARSSMVVPLSARGRTFGAIVFTREEDGPEYTDDELSFAEQVAARASIALDNARLYRDRAEIARTLQRALKPHDPPPIAGIDLATRYLAAGEGVEVGGDFYDVWEDEGVLWVAIGDVTGKGPSAVDLNLLSRHTIRTAAMRGDDPATILRTLNRALLERGSGERFCTALVCRFDLANTPVAGTIVSGGHPLPFVLRADGTLERAGRPGTLLGLFNEVRLEPSRLVLGAGDAMVLYTDGVIEERAGIQQFGAEGLAHELLGSVGRSAEGMAEAIEAAVRRVRPGGELLDDVALVVVRPTG